MDNNTPITVSLPVGMWNFLIAAGNKIAAPRELSQPIMSHVEQCYEAAMRAAEDEGKPS